MPDFCTCGAELPPDARFCHRCGKPQREEVIPEIVEARAETAPVVAPIPPAVVPSPHVSFHNPMAVRIGLLMASAASLSSPLPVWLGGLVGLTVWWLFAGFLAVYIYRRQTGQFLTVDSGLRMGWITGLLGSTMTAVLFTISMVPLARSGGIASLYAERLRTLSASDPNVQQQALKVLESPSGVAILIIIALLLVFAIVTFFCTAGGALGAKFGGKP